MRAGTLNNRVTVERIDENQDADGYEKQTFKPWKSFWSSVVNVSGTERSRGIQIEAGITTLVEFLFSSDTSQITSGMRILYGNRKLNIERVYDPEESRVRIVCQCKEVA